MSTWGVRSIIGIGIRGLFLKICIEAAAHGFPHDLTSGAFVVLFNTETWHARGSIYINVYSKEGDGSIRTIRTSINQSLDLSYIYHAAVRRIGKPTPKMVLTQFRCHKHLIRR